MSLCSFEVQHIKVEEHIPKSGQEHKNYLGFVFNTPANKMSTLTRISFKYRNTDT